MSDAAIKAALEAAAEACRDASHMCATGDLAALSKCLTTKAWQPCRCRRQATAAVAAFLRALPDWHEVPPGRSASSAYLCALAAAVEAAAREGE